MNPDISVIIPFLNEEENIAQLNSSLNEFTSAYKDLKFEIIFVDDGSADNSVDILKSFSFHSFVKIIKLSRNFGSHSALRAGINISTGKYTTFAYADLQDPLSVIIKMHELCVNGNDVVWAIRNSTKYGFFEKIFSGMYAKLMQMFVNPEFPKNGFDVCMFNSKIKAELNKNIESNSSIFLQILDMGFKQKSVTYDKTERKLGKSKWTFSKKFKLFIDSFVAFSYVPIRMVTVTGIVFFFSGLLWTLYIVLRQILVGDLSPGWPALVSILMICFGVSNISLGIIAEYLWRTLDASRKRPVFIINEIFEINKKSETQ
ncbi:MAG: glycosyltransferase [Ignavibacteria bacterium]|nr:glycosyltransferase [Ignavibacteria bacterium]